MFLMKIRTLILYFMGSDGVQAVERNRRVKRKARIKKTRKTCKVLRDINSFVIRGCFSVSSVYGSLCYSAVCPFFVEGSVGFRDIEGDPNAGNSSSGDWLECTIEVEVRRDSQDPTRKNPSYLDDLVVELMLGLEVESESGKTFEFFRSEASLVSLKERLH